MGKRVTYFANLDEFLYTKFGISHETQEHISKSVNSMERKLTDKSERRSCATEKKMPAWQSSGKLNQFKELRLYFFSKTEHLIFRNILLSFIKQILWC